MKTSCITLISAIATSVGAIATAVMAYLTRKTLCENRRQYDETTKQWEEENRAILVFRIVLKYDLWCIEVSNVGNKSAHDICFDVDTSFTKKLLAQDLKERIEETKYPLLKANETKCFPFALSESYTDKEYSKEQIINNIVQIEGDPIPISGSYRNYTKTDRIPIKETLFLRKGRSFAMLINDPLETIANSIEDIKTECLNHKQH